MGKLNDTHKVIIFLICIILFIFGFVCGQATATYKNNKNTIIANNKLKEMKKQIEKDESEYGNDYQKCAYVKSKPDRIYFKKPNENGFYLFEKNDESFDHLFEVAEDRMAYSVMEDFNLYCFTPDSIDTMMESGDNYIIFDYDNTGLIELDSDYSKNLIFRFSQNTRLYRLVEYLSYNKKLISVEELGKDEFASETTVSGYTYMTRVYGD